MENPAIDEIRKIRHKISAKFNHDPKRLVDYLMERQKEHPERLYNPDASENKESKTENETRSDSSK